MKINLNNIWKYGTIVIITILILSSFGASGYNARISNSEGFLKNTSQPPIPDLIYPEDGSIIHDDTPTFRWSSVDDPSGIGYTLQYSNDPTFQTAVTVEDILINIYTVPLEEALDEDIDYYWRVRAVNGEGNFSEWSETWSFIIDLSMIFHTTTEDFESGTLDNLTALDDEVKLSSFSPAWIRTYHNAVHDIIWDTEVDAFNNVYITGNTGQNIWGGSCDYLTVKYDENGNMLYAKTYNYTNWDRARGIAADSKGNIYVSGFSSSSIMGGNNGVIATIKYDQNGDTVWTQIFDHHNNSDTTEEGYDVAVAPSGDVYVTGRTFLDDNGQYQHGLLIIKYDENGEEIWNRSHEISNDDDIIDADIEADSLGNIYIAGIILNQWQGSLWFSFLKKFDENGSQIWSRKYNRNICFEHPYIDIAIDSNNNAYYSTTLNSGEFGFGAYLTMKHDSNGTKLWEKEFDGDNDDPYLYWYNADGIAVDSLDNVYITGTKSNTIYNEAYHFTIKYDPDGNLNWSLVYDSAGMESVAGIEIDSNDNLYIASNIFLDGGYIDCHTMKYQPPLSGLLTSSELISTAKYINGANATWNADIPEGTSIEVEVSNDAGTTWHQIENGETIEFPESGHILKYRLTMSRSNKTKNPVLHDITLYSILEDAPPDDQPPVVEIKKPEKTLYIGNREIIPLPFKPWIIGGIDIDVDASDDQSDIERVEFYIDDELKETDTTEPYSWTWDERTLLRFRHTIKVIAYDNADNNASDEICVMKFF